LNEEAVAPTAKRTIESSCSIVDVHVSIGTSFATAMMSLSRTRVPARLTSILAVSPRRRFRRHVAFGGRVASVRSVKSHTRLWLFFFCGSETMHPPFSTTGWIGFPKFRQSGSGRKLWHLLYLAAPDASVPRSYPFTRTYAGRGSRSDRTVRDRMCSFCRSLALFCYLIDAC
jgi:hypothetical protein